MNKKHYLIIGIIIIAIIIGIYIYGTINTTTLDKTLNLSTTASVKVPSSDINITFDENRHINEYNDKNQVFEFIHGIVRNQTML